MINENEEQSSEYETAQLNVFNIFSSCWAWFTQVNENDESNFLDELQRQSLLLDERKHLLRNFNGFIEQYYNEQNARLRKLEKKANKLNRSENTCEVEDHPVIKRLKEQVESIVSVDVDIGDENTNLETLQDLNDEIDKINHLIKIAVIQAMSDLEADLPRNQVVKGSSSSRIFTMLQSENQEERELFLKRENAIPKKFKHKKNEVNNINCQISEQNEKEVYGYIFDIFKTALHIHKVAFLFKNKNIENMLLRNSNFIMGNCEKFPGVSIFEYSEIKRTHSNSFQGNENDTINLVLSLLKIIENCSNQIFGKYNKNINNSELQILSLIMKIVEVVKIQLEKYCDKDKLSFKSESEKQNRNIFFKK